MGAFPSGQRGQTVNLLSVTSVVRIHPLPPENDKFRQKLVVFSYIRLTASYMHLRCVIFASQVICLRALGANIISLKPQVSISHFAQQNISLRRRRNITKNERLCKGSNSYAKPAKISFLQPIDRKTDLFRQVGFSVIFALRRAILLRSDIRLKPSDMPAGVRGEYNITETAGFNITFCASKIYHSGADGISLRTNDYVRVRIHTQ